MSDNYQIDKLDKKILTALMDNARVAYAELGKRFDVSAGTIHVRVEKMKQAGIIEGTKVKVNAKSLGYDVCCFVGINLKSAGHYHQVVDMLNQIDEVVEAYYTTGQYSIFVKLMTQSIEKLQWVLIDKIQSIEQVQSTETLISLQNPISRDVNP
jgi:Lrp/AsnC family transcriptional regulator for asnA, asnC and gidA